MEQRWGCCSKIYGENTTLERVLEGVRKAGIHYIELAAIPGYREHVVPEKMDAEAIQQLKKMLESFDIEAVSVAGHSELWQEEGLRIFMERMRFAADAGIKIINTGPGKTPDDQSKESFFKNMEKVVTLAEELDLTIGLEIHGELTAHAEACKATLSRIDSPRVGINYDTANVIFFSGVKPEEDIGDIASSLVHVHLKDIRGGKGSLDFPVLGEGDVNFAKVLSVLHKAGYNGPCCIELEMVDIVKGLTDEDIDKALLSSVGFLNGLLIK